MINYFLQLSQLYLKRYAFKQMFLISYIPIEELLLTLYRKLYHQLFNPYFEFSLVMRSFYISLDYIIGFWNHKIFIFNFDICFDDSEIMYHC